MWSAATATYFAFRDDVLTRLIARQAEMQYAYEDRIAELRARVDRTASRQLLDQEQFDQKLDQIMRRQTALESRATALGTIPDAAATGSVRPQARGAATSGARDSSRASRSGGVTKITVSLIGEGFGVPDGVSVEAPRPGARTDPVTEASGMAPSAVARDSSAVWRRMIWSSFWSNCSWSSNCRLVVRSTRARSSAMRSS